MCCSARCIVLFGSLCVATLIYMVQWALIDAEVRPTVPAGPQRPHQRWQTSRSAIANPVSQDDLHSHVEQPRQLEESLPLPPPFLFQRARRRNNSARTSSSRSNLTLTTGTEQRSCFRLDRESHDGIVDLPIPQGLDDAPGPGPLTRCIWNATSAAELGLRFSTCRASHLRRIFASTRSAPQQPQKPPPPGERDSREAEGSVVCHVDCAFAGLTNQLLCNVYHIVGCLLVGSTEIVFDEVANSRTRTNFGFRYGQNTDRGLWKRIPQSLVFDTTHLRSVLEDTLHVRCSTRPSPRSRPDADIVLMPHHTDVIGMELFVVQGVMQLPEAVRRSRRVTIAGARNALHRTSAHYFKLSRVADFNQRRVWPLTLLKVIMTEVFRLAAYAAPPSPMGLLFRHLRHELLAAAAQHTANHSTPSDALRDSHESNSESYGVYHFRAEEDFTSFLRVAGFGVRPTPSEMLDRFVDVKNRVFPFVRRWYIASGIFNEPESKLSSMAPRERDHVFQRLRELRASGEILYADYESPVRQALRRHPLEVSAAFDLFMAFEGDAMFGQHQTSFATASCGYLLFRGNGCVMLDNFNPFFSASLWIHLYHWYPESIREQMAQWTDNPKLVQKMKQDMHLYRWDL